MSELLAPNFHDIYRDVVSENHSHYWLYGGRGGTKSSFISVAIVMGIIRNPEANAICMRQYGTQLHTSVFSQMIWAIQMLGVRHLFKIPKVDRGAPPITYIPTGQKIFFSGLDDPDGLRSFKTTVGYLKYSWYEELHQLDTLQKVRNANQTIRRGSDDRFITFYSYNPPRNKNNWVNMEREEMELRDDAMVHLSTWEDLPRNLASIWLGEDWISDALLLKETDDEAYKHEYMGIPVGYGTGVFNNIVDLPMTEQIISTFDNVGGGVDWGFADDPVTFTLSHYDSKRKELYIFEEIFQTGILNQQFGRMIESGRYNNELIVADSAEPKSIVEMQLAGFNMIGAQKGSGSVEYGIKQLQELNAIYIDKEKCPNTYREFLNAEYDVDRYNNVRPHLVKDKNNHIIDNIRYRMEREWVGSQWGWRKGD